MEVLNQVVEIIRPETMGDLFVYGIFLLSMLNLAFIPEKNDLPVYLHYAIILMCILDLLREGAALPIEGTGDTASLRLCCILGCSSPRWCLPEPFVCRKANAARITHG